MREIRKGGPFGPPFFIGDGTEGRDRAKMASDMGWRRLTNKDAFIAQVADRHLSALGLSFVLHSDGRITGTVGDAELSGQWHWQDGFFCRSAALGQDPPDEGCEVIEVKGAHMRYTRDRGRGEAHSVGIGPRI